MVNVPPLPEKLTPYPVIANVAFAEGPIFDADGNLYFVNYIEIGTLGRMQPDGTVGVWVHTGGRVNGLKYDVKCQVDSEDHLGNRITLLDTRTRKMEVLTTECDGRPYIGPNDICLDLAGNVYFTDSGKNEQSSDGGVYRIQMDQDNQPAGVTRLLDQMPFPNGLAVHPDQKRFFISTSGTSAIRAYDFAEDGSLADERIVRQFPTPTVDGMQFDEYGRLWAARWLHGTIDVVDPESGELLASYPVGGDRVTNLAWWGQSLYVTVAVLNSIMRLDVGVGPADIIPR